MKTFAEKNAYKFELPEGSSNQEAMSLQLQPSESYLLNLRSKITILLRLASKGPRQEKAQFLKLQQENKKITEKIQELINRKKASPEIQLSSKNLESFLKDLRNILTSKQHCLSYYRNAYSESDKETVHFLPIMKSWELPIGLRSIKEKIKIEILKTQLANQKNLAEQLALVQILFETQQESFSRTFEKSKIVISKIQETILEIYKEIETEKEKQEEKLAELEKPKKCEQPFTPNAQKLSSPQQEEGSAIKTHSAILEKLASKKKKRELAVVKNNDEIMVEELSEEDFYSHHPLWKQQDSSSSSSLSVTHQNKKIKSSVIPIPSENSGFSPTPSFAKKTHPSISYEKPSKIEHYFNATTLN